MSPSGTGTSVGREANFGLQWDANPIRVEAADMAINAKTAAPSLIMIAHINAASVRNEDATVRILIGENLCDETKARRDEPLVLLRANITSIL